jgi:GTP-binding protein
VDDLDTLRKELQLFEPALAAKPQIVAANKMDAVDPDDHDGTVEALSRRAADLQLPFFRISGVTGAGIPELLEAMWARLAAARQPAA